jgi:succinylglutamate desuccinylase
MKISYAITVCNELEEISRLLNFLHQHKRTEDEICVLLDKPKSSQELLDELYYWSSKDVITLKESAFQGHFADWKNELTAMCSGDYIFQIDAD